MADNFRHLFVQALLHEFLDIPPLLVDIVVVELPEDRFRISSSKILRRSVLVMAPSSLPSQDGYKPLVASDDDLFDALD
jgi:hypothetical protein